MHTRPTFLSYKKSIASILALRLASVIEIYSPLTSQNKRTNRKDKVVNSVNLNACSPIIILLAIDVPVTTEARDLSVETLTAVRALETRGVPPPVDRLKIEPVGYSEATSRTNYPGNVLGLRGRRGRWLELGNSMQVLRRGLLLLRLQMGMMVVMMMVVVVRGLRWHAQVTRVLKVTTSVFLSARCNDMSE